MENNDFFTQEEHKQLILLYKRLLRLSKDTLQKDDCHKLKTHLVKAMAEGTIPRNVFQMNPIIKDMQTAVIVAEEIGMRRASILGIMLHESVKYNLCSLESVKEEYGEDVAGIIRGLVKINELYSKSPIIESENFRNLLLSFAEDMRVILIIIADRVNLMRQIKDSPNEEARLEVSNEAAYLYAPLAHKLGLYKLKSELEATKGKTGYKIVEVEKEVAADSLLQVITRPYRGKMVLVDMWNTWCGPCMRAMKSLKPLKEELKEVVYLYIVDETSPEGKWKVMIPDIPGIHCRISNEQSTALAKLYEYPGIPTYFVVNREGDISYKATGFPGVEMLRNELTK